MAARRGAPRNIFPPTSLPTKSPTTPASPRDPTAVGKAARAIARNRACPNPGATTTLPTSSIDAGRSGRHHTSSSPTGPPSPSSLLIARTSLAGNLGRTPAPPASSSGRNSAPLSDRKSVVSGKGVTLLVDLGGRRIIKQKINIHI